MCVRLSKSAIQVPERASHATTPPAIHDPKPDDRNRLDRDSDGPSPMRGSSPWSRFASHVHASSAPSGSSSVAIVESLAWASGSWRSRPTCCMPRLALLRIFYTQILLFPVWLFMVMPAIMAIGLAWCRLSNARRSGSAAIRSGGLAFGKRSGISPAVHALDSLAAASRLRHRQAGAGAPCRPGCRGSDRLDIRNRSVYSASPDRVVDAASGNVGLLIDPNPSGDPGFVRVRPGTPPDVRGPIIGSDLNVELGAGWSYRGDD